MTVLRPCGVCATNRVEWNAVTHIREIRRNIHLIKNYCAKPSIRKSWKVFPFGKVTKSEVIALFPLNLNDIHRYIGIDSTRYSTPLPRKDVNISRKMCGKDLVHARARAPVSRWRRAMRGDVNNCCLPKVKPFTPRHSFYMVDVVDLFLIPTWSDDFDACAISVCEQRQLA